MNPVWLIFRKEVFSALRDRRILVSTVIVPLLVLPLVTTLPMALIGSKERQARERPSSLVLSGLKFPELEQALRASPRFTFITTDSAARDIRLNRLDAALEVVSLPDGRQSAQVRVLFNATRTESRAASDKVKLVISDVSRQLLARQIDTTRVNLNPVKTIPANVASEREMAGFFMGMLVGMMAVIGLISGGMVMAIDCTAGEKERRTLEILLAAPVPRSAIVLGKFLATLMMGLVSVTLMTTGYAVSFTIGIRQLARGSEMPFGPMAVSWPAIPLILAVMVCVAAFIAALEMAVSIFARSYREAQTYLTPLTIIAVVPVMFLQTLPATAPDGLFYVPLLNAMLLIRELLMGLVRLPHIFSTVASSFICALLALRLALTMFRKESVLLR